MDVLDPEILILKKGRYKVNSHLNKQWTHLAYIEYKASGVSIPDRWFSVMSNIIVDITNIISTSIAEKQFEMHCECEASGGENTV